MKSPICKMLGIEFPLLAFSHCRDVVAAVSRAGGFGVLGATVHSPETIEQELKWIDDHVDGKPYGVDVLIPENISTAGEKNVTWKSLEARIPQAHRDYTKNLLRKYDIDLTTSNVADNQPQPFDATRALELLDVSFRHPIRLIANALGVPPKEMIEMGKKHGVPVAALVGAKEHALRQVASGVDILVVQGTEAGGHCGEVSTMVLLPEVIKAIKPIRDVPAGRGRHHDGTPDGSLHGDGRGRRVDRLGLACNDGVGDDGNLSRENDRGFLARCGPFQGAHRKAGTAIALGLDRCLGSIAGESRRTADAAAVHHQPRRVQFDRPRGGCRQPESARPRELLCRPGGRADRQREIGRLRGAGVQGRFSGGDRAHECVGRGLTVIARSVCFGLLRSQ